MKRQSLGRERASTLLSGAGRMFRIASALTLSAVGIALSILGVAVIVHGPLSDVGGSCLAVACASGPLFAYLGAVELLKNRKR